MHYRDRHRGVALITVLLLAALLVILVGSFALLNRANFAVSSDLEQGSQARMAARSGLDYACSRLSESVSWGSLNGDTAWQQTLDSSHLKVWEREQSGVVSVVGVMGNGDTAFQFHFQPPTQDVADFPLVDFDSIARNPASPASWTFQAELESARWISTNNFEGLSGDVPLESPKVGFRTLPGRAAQVQVIARSGQVERRIDATLRRPNLFDQSIVARGGLGVGLVESTHGGTTEPGQWNLLSADPFVNEAASVENLFSPDVVTLGPASEGIVNFGDRGGRLLSGEDILLTENFTLSGGNPDPGVVLNAVIGDDPSGDDIAEQQAALSNSGGQYIPNSPLSEWIPQEGHHLGVPVTATELDPGTYEIMNDTTVQHTAPNGTIQTYTGSTVIGTTPVQIANGELRIPEDSLVVVPGDLALVRDISYHQQAHLSLGQTPEGGLGESPTKLEVHGEIRLGAALSGSGSVEATGNVHLQGRSAVSAPDDSGIALFTDQKVFFEPVDPVVGTETQITQADWTAFNQILGGVSDGTVWNHNNGINNWATLNSTHRSKQIRNSGSGGPFLIPGGIATREGPSLLPALEEKRIALGLPTGVFPTGTGLNLNTVDGYVRASLYLEKVAQTGSGDLALISPGASGFAAFTSQVDSRIGASMDAFFARRGNESLMTYLGPGAPTPIFHPANPRDAQFKGVIYAQGGIEANMGGYRFYIDGALVSEDDIWFEEVNQLVSRYNPELVERFGQHLGLKSSGGRDVTIVYSAEY